jgi:TolB-like protein/Flp pilus assembly protein TadD
MWQLRLELGGETSRPVWATAVLLALGEREEAITAFVRDWEKASLGLRLRMYGDFRHHPAYAAIRDDPRMRTLLAEHEETVRRLRRQATQPPAEKAPGAPASAGGAKAAADKSVAVLAFDNRSADKEAEAFSDGMSDELIRVLGRVPGLTVKGSTSAFFFKGRNATAQEIGEKLGAAYLVRGTVQKSGTTVRISAQLTKSATDEVVWVSEPLKRELKDVWTVQEEIAGLIAKNLQLKLDLTKPRAPVPPEAYARLLQGRAEFRRESIEGWNQAIAHYRAALALEPAYALAWAETAQAYVRLARFGGLPTTEGMREARAAAEKALALDADEAVGWDALAWVQRTADWNWREAQKSFQRARELEPGGASALSGAAVLHFNMGRVPEAIALGRLAVERDPLRASVYFSLGSFLVCTEAIDEGCRMLARAIELAPAAEQYRHNLAVGLAYAGRHEEAAKVISAEPNPAYRLAGQALTLGVRGDLAAARAARDEFIGRFSDRMPAVTAMTFAVIGDRDQAFAWLDRSLARRDSDIVWTKTARQSTLLRSDPRWEQFLQKMGLSDEQLK